MLVFHSNCEIVAVSCAQSTGSSSSTSGFSMTPPMLLLVTLSHLYMKKNVSIGGTVGRRTLGRQQHHPRQTADLAVVLENRKAGGEKSRLETVMT